MRTLKNRILLIAVLSMVLVACSKEEVKPFNSGGGSAATLPGQRTASNDVDNGGSSNSNTESNGVTVGEEGTNGGGTEGDDSGITDGGTSSDYDSKGTKRKPGKN